MKKIKRTAIVERGKGKGNFSCFVPEGIGNWYLGGYGRTAREAMEDVYISFEEYKADAKVKNIEFPDEVEIDFKLDIGSFFDYYPLDVTTTAKYIGINASVLRQYVTGLRYPKQEQITKIREGLSKLFSDMSKLNMIEKPTVQYV